MMNVKFTNPTHQAQFDENGYVLMNLLSSDELETCKALADKYIPTDAKGIYTNIFYLSTEENLLIGKTICDIVQPHLSKILPEYKATAATFIAKEGGAEKTNFCLHQDASVVDEKKFTTLGLWIPLIDTNKENGGLCILPGSHVGNPFTIRSAQSPSIEIKIDEQFEPFIGYLEVKAGQAIIFSHQLLHGSPANLSSKRRIIIHAGLVPQNAQEMYFMRDLKGQIQILATEQDFYYDGFLSVWKGEIPNTAKVIGKLASFPPQLTHEHVLANMRKKRGIETPMPKHSIHSEKDSNFQVHEQSSSSNKKMGLKQWLSALVSKFIS